MTNMSQAALRKRVSRIEKKAPSKRTAEEAQLVAEYRKKHRRYHKTTDAVRAVSSSRPLDDEDLRALDEQLAGEAMLAAEGSQTDIGTENVDTNDVTVAGDVTSQSDVIPDVTSFVGETMDVVTTNAGVCPVGTCRAPLTDGQLRCGKCGANVRPDLCPKCRDPYADGEKFCRRDGTPRPSATAASVTVNKQGQPVIVDEPIRMWDAKNTRWLMDGVNMILARTEMDELDEDEKKQLVGALVPVLNKRLPASGAWAEEIRLGVVVAGVFFPRFYIKWILLPERKEKERRKEELHRAELARIQASTRAPSNEQPVTLDAPTGAA